MDDILASIQKILDDVNIATPSLQEAVLSKKRVENEIKFVNRAMEEARVKQSEEAFISAKETTIAEAPAIYAKKVKDAASRSEEYSYEQFLSPLLEVGFDDGLYNITSTGAGWSRSVNVHLNMDEVAGTIGDYAEAVESARGSLGTKEDRDPDLASKIWRTKIYRHSRYFTTIKLRLLAAASPAPFWSLLNDGSKNVSMASDIGGSPYPSRGGHHFVEQTEDAIRLFFLSTFRKAKEKYDSDVILLKDALLDARDLLVRLQNRVDELSSNSDLLSKVASEIGVSSDQLDASKIIVAADRIRSGDIFTTQVVVGRGIRIRTKKFTELVTGFDE
jgi:hypothetical protein